jgi:hypothetical protein
MAPRLGAQVHRAGSLLREGAVMDSSFSFPVELIGPSELQTQSPRRVLLTGHGVQIIIAGAILLALAAAGVVWVGSYAQQQTQRDSLLLRSGRQAEAAITRLQSSGTFAPRVNYTFTAGDATYAGQARVPTKMAHALAGSRSLPVLYLPDNPAISRPAVLLHSPHSEEALFIAPAVAAFLGLLLFVLLFDERRMAVQGTPVLAVITKCTRARNGFLLDYAFRLENQQVIKGHGWYQTYQEPGAGIWALYLRKKPRRNVPYPLSCCRIVG